VNGLEKEPISKPAKGCGCAAVPFLTNTSVCRGSSVSYARAERDLAQKLVTAIEGRNVGDVWWDQNSIAMGGALTETLREGIVSSERFVLIASKASAANQYVQRTPRGSGDGEADNHRLPRQGDLSGLAVEARRAARRGATGRVGALLGRRCRTVRSAPCGCADAQSRGTACMAGRSSVVLLARLGAAQGFIGLDWDAIQGIDQPRH